MRKGSCIFPMVRVMQVAHNLRRNGQFSNAILNIRLGIPHAIDFSSGTTHLYRCLFVCTSLFVLSTSIYLFI